MTTTAKNIKDAYKVAKARRAAAAAAVRNPLIEEDEFMAIVDAECEAYDVLIDALIEFSAGAITARDASNIVLSRFDKLGTLVERLAA